MVVEDVVEDRPLEVDQLVMIVVAVVIRILKMMIYARDNEITVAIRIFRVEVVIVIMRKMICVNDREITVALRSHQILNTVVADRPVIMAVGAEVVIRIMMIYARDNETMVEIKIMAIIDQIIRPIEILMKEIFIDQIRDNINHPVI